MRKQSNIQIKKRNSHDRKGMALLFVVSLILFITLLGTSFVVISQQFATSARNRTRIDATGDNPRLQVQEVMMDLLRGPELTNENSPLRTIALLPDMYGFGFAGDVSMVTAVAPTGAPGEFDIQGAIEFTLEPTSLERLIAESTTTPPPSFMLSDIPGAYNGLVLTFTEGLLTGTSVRVIGYSGADPGVYSGVPHTFVVYPEQTRDVPGTITDVNNNDVVDVNGVRVVVNGRAYSGFGGGGFLAAGGLSPEALGPNLRGVSQDLLAAYSQSGVNEPWDAVDYQNPWLAGGSQDDGTFVASFQRSNLADTDPAGLLMDRVSFRAFGSSMDLHVDNDGNGVLDSIWVDFGYPVQTDISGRRFKPLVAVMIQDMDGRLNINTHGTVFDLDPDGDGIINRAVNSSGTNLLGNVNPLDPANPGLPRGSYLGPPEISMASVFGTGMDYQNLLFDRYGDDNLPGNATIRDAWPTYVQFGHPDLGNTNESYPNQFVGGLFGTWSDPHGRFGRGIPHLFDSTDSFNPVPTNLSGVDVSTTLIPIDEIRNSPYEFDLLEGSRFASTVALLSDDQPFTAKEYERILRQFDRDARMLPSRLSDLIGNFDPQMFGPASFETPAIPSLLVGTEFFSVNDLLYNVLINNGADVALISSMLTDMLAPEVRMGLPFDLNRPFGDGKDNDGDGIYDEFDELTLNNEFLNTVTGGTRAMDPDGDGNVGTDSEFSRYQFAKHLYVLALLVTNDGDFGPVTLATPNGQITDADVIRRFTLAQWAVNVVDFRDSDSIHTAFEFDLDPFNADGWTPDGDPATDETGSNSFTIWGMERPELLLTESMAFHARRAQDLSVAGGGTVADGDELTFDQRLIPIASAHFELYRPWSQNAAEQLHPRELGATNSQSGINLTAQPVAGHPVWRLVVSTADNLNSSRDVSQLPGRDAIGEAEEFRRIYFTEPGMAVEPVINRHKAYWPDNTIAGQLSGNSFIQPGGYAVVGSAGTLDGSRYRTFFGRRTDPDFDTLFSTTRGIALLPGSGQVELISDTTEVFSAVAIPINQTVEQGSGTPITRSLGLSDPVNGYFDYVGLSDVITNADGHEFTSARDLPLDQDPSVQTDENDRLAVLTNGTFPNFRSVYLQRLADPTQAFDAVLNPYLTIDRQLVDLTSTNGAETETGNEGPEIQDANPRNFVSNERGRHANPDVVDGTVLPIQERRVLWRTDFAEAIQAASPIGDLTHHFDFAFVGSFGSLNLTYRHPEFTQTGASYIGFGDLAWNNRPFANHMELLDVPFTSPFEFVSNPSGDPEQGGIGAVAGYENVGYTLDKLAMTGNPYEAAVRGGQFGHLLNFFSPGEPGNPGNANSTEPRNLANLLDFVRVPSRFAGTQRVLTESSTLAPPFNMISRYREPGKMNANTIYHDEVSQAWLGEIGTGFSAMGQFADGSPGATFGVMPIDRNAILAATQLDPAVTISSPFRPATVEAVLPAAIDAVGSQASQAGLLRDESGVGGGTAMPLFQVNTTPGTAPPWANPARSSRSRFETLRRTGGITTTRSSVFAVWITVGQFEVDEQGELVMQNGAAIEIGALEGREERARGFYMIDRSIPVGVEPGRNHNVENTILIESILD